MTQELWTLDGVALRSMLVRRDVSARDIAEAHLARVAKVNPAVNALVDVRPDETLARADELDRLLAAGTSPGPMFGIPMSMKITNQQAGYATNSGVSLWQNMVAQEDGPLTAALRKAGAMFLGRNNSPAFAMRFHTDNMLYGKTYNPWNREITAGGSSGGAGAAVAAGLQPIAQGNDIGGSIRWPAFCNGVLGLRPTPGRIGGINPASAAPRTNSAVLMAVQGPIARSVRDLRLAFSIMAATPGGDPLWVPAPIEPGLPASPLRVGLVTGGVGKPDLHPAAVAAVERAGAILAAAGHEVETIDMPGYDNAGQLWSTIGMSEIRLVLEPMLDQVGDPDLVKSLRGWWATMPKEVDLRAYLGALAERDRLIREWNTRFGRLHAIITPVCAVPSVKAFSDTEGPAAMTSHMETGRFLLLNALLGFPVLASRVGMHEGMPQGVQVIAPRWREDICLAIGEEIERAEGPIVPVEPR